MLRMNKALVTAADQQLAISLRRAAHLRANSRDQLSRVVREKQGREFTPHAGGPQLSRG